MPRKSVLALALLAATSTQAAAQDPACEDMELFYSSESIEFLGDEADSAQIGDRRIITGRLHDAEGNDVGRFHTVNTLLGDTANGHLVTGAGSILFPTGEIFVTFMTEVPDAASETSSTPAEVHDAIVGGTRAFAHASGTEIVSPPEDDPSSLDNWTVAIDIQCDG